MSDFSRKRQRISGVKLLDILDKYSKRYSPSTRIANYLDSPALLL